MGWQAECWRDLERIRSELREDLGGARDRRVPVALRAGVWAGLSALAAATGEAAAAVPAVVLFEAFVAPRLGRPRPPSIGPLRPWHPPESYRESPEAPAPWVVRGP